MNLYFFFRNDSCSSWYNCAIEAWAEEDDTWRNGNRFSAFKLLEKLEIHICKHPEANEETRGYHAARLYHDFSGDSNHNHYAKSQREFLLEKLSKESRPMKRMELKDFRRFRKVILNIYATYPPVDYAAQLAMAAPHARIIIG